MRRVGCWVALCALGSACNKEAPRERLPPAEPSTIATASRAPEPETLPYATLTLGGGEREQLPWIVALHGLGDTPDDFIQLLQSELRAHVYAPRALYPYGDGFDWFRVRVQGDPERLAEALRHAMAEVLRFVDARTQDPKNVGKPVVLGFSQGGMLSFALGAHHPERFRLVVPIGGLLPEPLWPKARPRESTPIVALHGTDDRVVPIAPARALTGHLGQLGYRADLLEFEGVGHGIPRQEHERLIEILASELK